MDRAEMDSMVLTRTITEFVIDASEVSLILFCHSLTDSHNADDLCDYFNWVSELLGDAKTQLKWVLTYNEKEDKDTIATAYQALRDQFRSKHDLSVAEDPLYLSGAGQGLNRLADILGSHHEFSTTCELAQFQAWHATSKDLFSEAIVNPSAFGGENASRRDLSHNISVRLEWEWLNLFRFSPFLAKVYARLEE